MKFGVFMCVCVWVVVDVLSEFVMYVCVDEGPSHIIPSARHSLHCTQIAVYSWWIIMACAYDLTAGHSHIHTHKHTHKHTYAQPQVCRMYWQNGGQRLSNVNAILKKYVSKECSST